MVGPDAARAPYHQIPGPTDRCNPRMEPIRVSLSEGREYSIHQRPLGDLPALLRANRLDVGKCLVVTDLNVGTLYEEVLTHALMLEGWSVETVTVPAGETSKTSRYLQEIYDVALRWGVDRQTIVVALGGGVVGDLGGYAAATLLRGLPLVQAPTSLLAQVDSAIGGKTGINHESGKNLIGAFHQPRLVCADPATLKTLPHREWIGGLSEIVKHGLIDDRGFFAWLQSQGEDLLEPKSESTPELISRSAAVKARIVSRDELEQGTRIFLNLGHTFAHAIENVSGYGTVSHGEAVHFGLRAALILSSERQPDQDFNPALDLLALLPSSKVPSGLDVEEVIAAMATDKKTVGGRLRLILLKRIGKPYVASDVSPQELAHAWQAALGA